MIRSISVTVAVLTLFSSISRAENVPAKNCQIFIKKVTAAPSSHGIQHMLANVKVNWIGNDEFIKKVGMYRSVETIDIGNAPECHSGYDVGVGPFEVKEGNRTSVEGEYSFEYNIYSGSVVDPCPGYYYTNRVAFFVETTKNTYWLNPGFDSNQYFYFDENGYRNLVGKGGMFYGVSTDRDDMKYYNPGSCR